MKSNDWAMIKKRFDALWEGQIIDRCCARVTSEITDEKYNLSPPDLVNPLDYSDILDYWKNPERILKRKIDQINSTYYAADAFPIISPYFAPAGHAEFFGGKPNYSAGTIWFEHTISDLELQFPIFDQNHPSLNEQLQIYNYLVNKSNGRYMVSMPDNVGAADALSHLMGPEELLVQMMDSPDIVKKAIESINDGWEICADAFYNIVKDSTSGSSIGWLGTWGRGKHMQLQCDISVMLSAKMFEYFLVPELERQMQWIDIPLYHLDGEEQIKHLDLILDLPKLKMIQWTNVVGQPPASAYIDIFKRIQKAGKGLLLWISPEEIPWIMESLSSKGLFLDIIAKTQEEADLIVKNIERYTHE